MARTALDQLATQRPAPARRHRAGLVVQVDPLSGWGRLRDGEFLPPAPSSRSCAPCPAGRAGHGCAR